MSLNLSRLKQFHTTANIARGRADQILALPLTSEILERVLNNLDVAEILLCERTSRGFCRLIRGSVALQYKIERYLGCVEDGRAHTAKERFDGLREWRSRWHSAAWSANDEINLEGSFRGVQYGNGDLACAMKNGNEIYFQRIQSQARQVEGKSWSVKCPSNKAGDIVYDLAQDLLVVIESRSKGAHTARFLTMDGVPHPCAAIPRINIPCANIQDLYITTSYSGNLISAWFPLKGESKQLMVWNWSSGALILEATWRSSTNSSVPGFLDDRYIIVPGYMSFIGPAFLAVIDCKVPQTKKIASFSDLLDDAVLILDLPPLADGMRWVSIFMERSLQPMKPLAHSMFSPQRDSGIMGVIMWVKEAESTGQASQHVLIIPVAPIRARLLPLVGSTELGLVPRCPWKKWGSETRYLPIGVQKTYTSICMTRFATTQERHGLGEAKPEDILEIFDFDSLPSMLRDLASGDAKRMASIVHEPSKPNSDYFDTDVETMVPYRHLITEIVVPKGYDADLGEHSVVLHSSNNPRAFWYSI